MKKIMIIYAIYSMQFKLAKELESINKTGPNVEEHLENKQNILSIQEALLKLGLFNFLCIGTKCVWKL